MKKETSLVRGVLAGWQAAWVMNQFMGGPGQKEHLSREEKEKGGPIVHYAFVALAGGVYGGLAEYSGGVASGFGTTFGGVLFSSADLLAVPAFNLGPSPADEPPSALASPFAAHIFYGVTTELVRRILRALF